MACQKKIFLTPFSHLDLFWAGTRAECLTRGITVIKTALDLLDRYPEYRFMIEATNFLELFLEAAQLNYSYLMELKNTYFIKFR